VTLAFRLDGRRALVTGARRGLGRAIAAAFVQAGARVAISHVDESDAVEARATAAAIGALALPADLSRPGAGEALIAAAATALGGLDILVCNAAAERRETLPEMSWAGMENVWAVNLSATLEMIRAAIPHLGQGGRVLLLGSVQAHRPNPHQIAYAASKAALIHMGRNLAKQLAPQGIGVNILSPGAIATEGNANALSDAAYAAAVQARIPAGRIGEPADVVGAAVFLCSPAARYCVGAELLVDGGLSL
jgi:NAD(P)-dependent dehydrogenase (short-subunit alcohol dehydrogenase family)